MLTKSVLLARCLEMGTRLIIYPYTVILTSLPKPKPERVGLKGHNCHPYRRAVTTTPGRNFRGVNYTDDDAIANISARLQYTSKRTLSKQLLLECNPTVSQ